MHFVVLPGFNGTYIFWISSNNRAIFRCLFQPVVVRDGSCLDVFTGRKSCPVSCRNGISSHFRIRYGCWRTKRGTGDNTVFIHPNSHSNLTFHILRIVWFSRIAKITPVSSSKSRAHSGRSFSRRISLYTISGT